MRCRNYEINGFFDNNDEFTETATGLDELELILEKIDSNPATREWMLSRTDTDDGTFSSEELPDLLNALDDWNENGADGCSYDTEMIVKRLCQ